MARSIDDILRDAFETHARLDFPAAPPIAAPTRSRSSRRWVMPGFAAAAAVSVIVVVTVMATGNKDARPTPIAPILTSTTNSATQTSPSLLTSQTAQISSTSRISGPGMTGTGAPTNSPSAGSTDPTDPDTMVPIVVPPLTKVPAAYFDNLPQAQRDADVRRALDEIGANDEVGFWFRVEPPPLVNPMGTVVGSFTVGDVTVDERPSASSTVLSFTCGYELWSVSGQRFDPALGPAQSEPDLSRTKALVTQLLALMNCSDFWPFTAQNWDHQLAVTPEDWVPHTYQVAASTPPNLALVREISERVTRLGLTEFSIDHPQGDANGTGPWGEDEITISVHELANFRPKVSKVRAYLVQGVPLWETKLGAAHFECGGRSYVIKSYTKEERAKATGAQMDSHFDTALLFSQLMLMDLPCANGTSG